MYQMHSEISYTYSVIRCFSIGPQFIEGYLVLPAWICNHLQSFVFVLRPRGMC